MKEKQQLVEKVRQLGGECFICISYFEIAITVVSYIEESKTVKIIFPSDTNESGVDMRTRMFENQNDFTQYCRAHNGSLCLYERDLCYKDIVDGGVYAFGGAYFRASFNESLYRQVDAKVFEHESALSVQSYVGQKDAHIHSNYIFSQDDKVSEIDGIVHVGGQNILNSVAYVIEAQLNPPLSKIDKLLKKVSLFSKHIPNSEHFKSVTNVIPVLAGKHWSPELDKKCVEKNIWRVCPSGLGYKVIRSFSTISKMLK